MSKRICPNCQTILGSYDHYFCTVCSFELPGDLSVPSQNIVRTMKVEEPEKPKVSFKEHVLPAIVNVFHIIKIRELILIIVLSAVVSLPVYYWLSNFSTLISSQPGSNLSEQPREKKGMILEIEDNYRSHVFGANNIWEYVPYDVDAYVEGHDLEAAAELFGQFDEGYIPVFERLVPVVDSHFGAYLKKYDGEEIWVLLVFPYESQMIEDDPGLEDFEWLTTGKVDEILVISTVDATQDVSDSRNSLKKNLGDNPKFKVYIDDLPLSGKILLVSLSDCAKTYLAKSLGIDLPDGMKDILEKYLKTGFDNVVFK